MIDPLEAAIQFMLGRAELADLNGRIAAKHKYGEAWKTSESGLVVVQDDSMPSHYVPIQDLRLEVQCYAASDANAMDTWLSLVEIARNCSRVAVLTSKGDALVYSFLQESGPSYVPDKDLTTMKRFLGFWRVQVGETSVS